MNMTSQLLILIKISLDFIFIIAPLHKSLSGVYSVNDTDDVLSFYNYLEALLHKGGSELYGESKQPEDGAETD